MTNSTLSRNPAFSIPAIRSSQQLLNSSTLITHHSSLADTPLVQLTALDELWFQVAGTLCNLTCTHCFISCSPQNDSFGHLSLETVERMLAESVRHGVKEYYFTGGEPFLNREMVPILVKTLEYGPATVLTNGTVLKDEWLVTLRNAEAASLYSLEFRVSIDGPTAQINDPIRGEEHSAGPCRESADW